MLVSWIFSPLNPCQRKGHAFGSNPRSAPCLRIPVGYLPLSLPGVLELGIEARIKQLNPDYALEMHKRLTSCKSICMAKLITTAKSG